MSQLIQDQIEMKRSDIAVKNHFFCFLTITHQLDILLYVIDIEYQNWQS
jgi:hypothetical protein